MGHRFYLLAKPSHPVTFSLCFTDFQPASSLPNLPEMASGSSLKSLQGEGLCAHCRARTPLPRALWAPKGWRVTGQPSASEESSALRSRLWGCPHGGGHSRLSAWPCVAVWWVGARLGPRLAGSRSQPRQFLLRHFGEFARPLCLPVSKAGLKTLAASGSV